MTPEAPQALPTDAAFHLPSKLPLPPLALVPLRFERERSRELERVSPSSALPEIDLSCFPRLPPIAPCAVAALIDPQTREAASPKPQANCMHPRPCLLCK